MDPVKEAYTIVPFHTAHQEAIDEFMPGIQEEFAEMFSNPDALSISQMADPGHLFWVALYHGKAIGTIGLTRLDPRTGVIKRFFVAKEHRGRTTGVAQTLLQVLIDESKLLHFSGLYLGTMAQFKAAQYFYLKNHFVEVSADELPAKMPLNKVDTVFYYLEI